MPPTNAVGNAVGFLYTLTVPLVNLELSVTLRVSSVCGSARLLNKLPGMPVHRQVEVRSVNATPDASYRRILIKVEVADPAAGELLHKRAVRRSRRTASEPIVVTPIGAVPA